MWHGRQELCIPCYHEYTPSAHAHMEIRNQGGKNVPAKDDA